MGTLSREQINEDRERVLEVMLRAGYKPESTIIIDSVINEIPPNNTNHGLWYLGRSIMALANADTAIFAKGWENDRRCQIELECAKKYGILCLFANRFLRLE
jgi:hypothetical protein